MNYHIYSTLILGILINTNGFGMQQQLPSQDQLSFPMQNLSIGQPSNAPSSSNKKIIPKLADISKKIVCEKKIAPEPIVKKILEQNTNTRNYFLENLQLKKINKKQEEIINTPQEWTFASTGKKTREVLRCPNFSEIFIKLVNAEQKNITLSLFEFDLYPIAYALCRASKERQVKVEIIIDKKIPANAAQLLLSRCEIKPEYLSPTKDIAPEGGSVLHAKTATFSENFGRKYLDEITNQKSTKNSEKPIGLFWIGSYNFTENSENKCYENVLVSSVNRSFEYFKEKFKDNLKEVSESKKIKNLEKAQEHSKGESPLNALYLLQSKFLRSNGSYTHLTRDEILQHKDFVPSNLKQNFNNFPQIIPDNRSLPYPCFIFHNTSTNQKDCLKLPDGQCFPVTENETNATQLSNSKFYDQSNQQFLPNYLAYDDFTPIGEQKKKDAPSKPRIIPTGIELPFPCHIMITPNGTYVATKNQEWIILDQKHLRKNLHTGKIEYTYQETHPEFVVYLAGAGEVEADLNWFFQEQTNKEDYTLPQIQGLSDNNLSFKGPYIKSHKENKKPSFASITGLNKTKKYKPSELRIMPNQANKNISGYPLEEILLPQQNQ